MVLQKKKSSFFKLVLTRMLLYFAEIATMTLYCHSFNVNHFLQLQQNIGVVAIKINKWQMGHFEQTQWQSSKNPFF
jgi:hypothetical protein